MKGNYIPFLAFLSLILLTAFSSFNGATSVIPGWHTTIFPPYFIRSVVLIYPTVFMDMDQQNQTSILSEISFRLKLIPLAWILFGLGQIMFIVYYFRIVYNRAE